MDSPHDSEEKASQNTGSTELESDDSDSDVPEFLCTFAVDSSQNRHKQKRSKKPRTPDASMNDYDILNYFLTGAERVMHFEYSQEDFEKTWADESTEKDAYSTTLCIPKPVRYTGPPPKSILRKHTGREKNGNKTVSFGEVHITETIQENIDDIRTRKEHNCSELKRNFPDKLIDYTMFATNKEYAPDFTLTDLAGESYICPFCKEEVDIKKELYPKHLLTSHGIQIGSKEVCYPIYVRGEFLSEKLGRSKSFEAYMCPRDRCSYKKIVIDGDYHQFDFCNLFLHFFTKHPKNKAIRRLFKDRSILAQFGKIEEASPTADSIEACRKQIDEFFNMEQLRVLTLDELTDSV